MQSLRQPAAGVAIFVLRSLQVLTVLISPRKNYHVRAFRALGALKMVTRLKLFCPESTIIKASALQQQKIAHNDC